MAAMNELAYLGVAVIISVAGSVVVWFRQRQPRSLESGVAQFSRGLAALAAKDTQGSRPAPRR